MKHTFFCLQCNDNIFTNRQICQNSIFFSVLRKICHSLLHCIKRRIDFHFFSFYFNHTTIRFICPINCSYQFRTSRSKKSSKSHYFSFIYSKIERLDAATPSNLFRLNNRFKFFQLFMRTFNICKVIKLFPHHLCNQFHSRKFLHRILSHEFSISKHRNTVADLVYLLQEMSNKDNADPLFTKTTHQNKKFFNFFIVQRRSRFI